MRIAVLVLALTACGKRATPPPDPAHDDRAVASAVASAAAPAPSSDAAPPPDARSPPPFAGDPSQDLRALGVALAALDRDATKAWVTRAQAPRPDDAPRFDEPAPPSARAAIDALVAWDRSGAFVRVGCDPTALAPLIRGLDLGRAALEAAAGPDDPIVHAVLRLGQALRSGDNASLAISLGVQLARDEIDWLGRRHRHPGALERTFAPEPEVAVRAARAEVRCQVEALPSLRDALRDPRERAGLLAGRREAGLSDDDDAVDAELTAFEAFVRETQAQLARATTPDQVRRISETRFDASQEQHASTLIQALGATHAYRSVVDALDLYARDRDLVAHDEPVPPF